MTDQKRLRQLFDVVFVAPKDQRAAVAARVCGDDEALQRRVLNMVAAAEDDGAFLADPSGGGGGAFDVTIAPTASLPEEHAGDQIGPYKLLQQIGEGGFGVVWMAEQREPVKRRVALKVIKLGMDTRQVVARFMAERQALAMMDHPNIAKVFDAGSTATGRPYFVMEYIKGVPVTEYCDTERLDTDHRLELFQKVCHAIQHAHQKGIIHRDIKPSNVLVTMHDGVPVPKVIDFGVAKATNTELTAQTLFTEHKQMIGTPTYMSPEQAELSGLDIDTRADVYSLGVLLYELLTGTTPFDIRSLLQQGYAEMMRVIREQEPKKPSTRFSTIDDTTTRSAELRRADAKRLGYALRGDLDWIVMKCLEKDRTRRYETANGLAEDIRRHLVHEPITASPPSALYRLKKLVRRNRAGVTAAALVVLALLGGIAGTTYGLVEAQSQRDEAQHQSEIAQAVNDFLNQDLLAAVAPSTEEGRGVDVSMREVLLEASRRIDEASKPGGRFADKPAVEDAIRWTLYDTLERIGEWQEMAKHATRLAELRTGRFGAEHPTTLEAQRMVGLCLLRSQRNAECVAHFRKWIPVIERVEGERFTFFPRMNMAVSLAELGQVQETIHIVEAVAQRAEALSGPNDRTAAHAKRDLAHYYGLAGRHDEAIALLRAALAGHRVSTGDDSDETLQSMYRLGSALRNKGRGLDPGEPRAALLGESLALLDEAERRSAAFLGVAHPITSAARSALFVTLSLLRGEATAEGIARVHITAARDPKCPADGKSSAAWYLIYCAEPPRADVELALELITDAVALAEQGDASDPLANLLDTLARAQHLSGDAMAAVITQRRAIEQLPATDVESRRRYQQRLAAYEAEAAAREGR